MSVPFPSDGRTYTRRRWLALVAPLIIAATLVVAVPQQAHAAAAEWTGYVTSFDGTEIHTNLYVPASATSADPAPLVLRGHGWGGRGETIGSFSSTTRVLYDAGYAILTWDARGFGCSGGVVHVDKPDREAEDASALITWAFGSSSLRDRLRSDGGDPVVGFSGVSYAGGIQTATASIDERVDALAPEWSWSDLTYSLYAGDVVNRGWSQILYVAGVVGANEGAVPGNCPETKSGGLDPAIQDALDDYATTNQIDDASLDFFRASSLDHYVDPQDPGVQDLLDNDPQPIDVPSLVIQGHVDTLFDVTDGYGVYRHIADTGAPARFIAFCGGHVACPSSYDSTADDRAYLDQQIVTWFDRYLRGDDVDTGAPVVYRTNRAEWREAQAFPPQGTHDITGFGDGMVINDTDSPPLDQVARYAETFESGSGSGTLPPNPVIAAQPSSSENPEVLSFEVATAADGPLHIVGFPSATVEVTGTGPAIHLFLKLVDREAGQVLNVQEAPLRVEELSGEPQRMEVTFPGHAYDLPEGHHLDLQVATDSVMHSPARTAAEAQLDVEVTVPVLDDAVRIAGPTRIETAVAASRLTYPGPGSADAVVLARADDLADALAGTPLAEREGAPVLLTYPDELHRQAEQELERVLADGRRVFLLGGTAALSDAVHDRVRELGYDPRRIAGPTRIETAVAIADALGDPATLMVTTGYVFADAIAAGPAAAEVDGAVLLTAGDHPNPTTSSYLDRISGETVYAVGGPAARAYPDAAAVFGPTREHTAVEVARRFYDAPAAAGIARRDVFPDAMAGGAAMAFHDGPMLLTGSDRLPPVVGEYLCDASATVARVFVFGGSKAVADGVLGVAADRSRGQGCA